MNDKNKTELTKREYFAGLVMQGFCSNPSVFAANELCGWGLVNSTSEGLAVYATEIADVLIEALEGESSDDKRKPR